MPGIGCQHKRESPGGVVVRRKEQDALQGLRRGGGLAQAALRQGKIDARCTGAGIVREGRLPKGQSGSHIAGLRIQNRKIARRGSIERISLERLLVFGLSPLAVSAHLLQKSELCVKFSIRRLPRIGCFCLNQQANRALTGGTVAAQGKLSPRDSLIARTRSNATDRNQLFTGERTDERL